MDEYQRRAAQNEALFREVNARIEELDASFGVTHTTFTMVCECGSSACVDHIEISHEEYAEIRGDPTWFAVLPDHEDLRVESIIDDRGRYLVVEKRPGEPAEVARDGASDPETG
jgi:hypothetical protein